MLTSLSSNKVELEHRTSKGKYAFINKHNPEWDIGTLHHRIEVLQELANSRTNSSTTGKAGRMVSGLDSLMTYFASEDEGLRGMNWKE